MVNGNDRDEAVTLLRSLVEALDDSLTVRCPTTMGRPRWVSVEVWSPRLQLIRRLVRRARFVAWADITERSI